MACFQGSLLVNLCGMWRIGMELLYLRKQWRVSGVLCGDCEAERDPFTTPAAASQKINTNNINTRRVESKVYAQGLWDFNMVFSVSSEG